MIPFLIVQGASSPPGPMVHFFPGPLYATTMTTASSILVTAQYNLSPGVSIDSISFQVQKNGGSFTQWKQSDFPATESVTESDLWSSADAGFSGVGTYTFFAVARRVSTGLYDLTSNHINLTVT
jgi:hypothetical protein